MTKPRRKPRDGEPDEKNGAGAEGLAFFPPLYPYGAFPMTPPVFPNTGLSEVSDDVDEDFRDL